MYKRWWPAMSACVLLTACGGSGGGGVASTPTPPSAPSPSPSPNTSLFAPLTSESFANDAATGSATFAGITMPGSAASTPLTVSYNATAGSYTVATNGRSQTWGVSSQTAGTAQTSDYRVTKGDTDDILTLTKPGTSGPLTYQYVGGGFWQRSVNAGNSVSGSFDAFTYGVPTPDAARPRTGQASYDVTLLGTMATASWPYPLALSGSGLLVADFANGKVTSAGTLRGTDTGGTNATIYGDVPFASSATIGSTGTFNGLFNFADATMKGDINGRFYGPNAEEVGAVFNATGTSASTPNATSPNVAVGAIIGRRASTAVNDSFDAINVGQLLNGDTARLAFTGSAATSLTINDSSTGSIAAIVLPASSDAPGGLYALATPSRAAGFYKFQYDNGGRYDGYAYGGVSQYGEADYNIAVSSDQGLKYVKAGRWYSVVGNKYTFDDYTFGFTTPDAAVPRSGTGGYAVNVYGSVANVTDNRVKPFTGYGSLLVNFATGAVETTGSFTALGPETPINGGFSGTATIASGRNAFSGSFSLSGIGAYSGDWLGRFYGPAAQEVGAVFKTTGPNGSVATGTLAGASDSTIANSVQTLAGLTQATDLSGIGLMVYRSNYDGRQYFNTDGAITVAYDPVTKSYKFDSTTTGQNFGQATPIHASIAAADVDTARSEPGYTYYKKVGVDGKVLTIGPTNPAITLSYTSFADLNVTGTDGAPDMEHFVVFGFKTPTAQVPHSGTATYTGIVIGRGTYPTPFTDVRLDGTSRFDFDFGTSNWTASLALVGTATNGTTTNFGTFNFVNMPGGQAGGGFAGNSADNRLFYGTLSGAFYGKDVAELGAIFEIDLPIDFDQPNKIGTLYGITVAKKQ